jgi:hypothetical protein
VKNASTLLESLLLFACLSTVAGCGADTTEEATNDEALRATETLLCASSANTLVYYGDESQVLLEANVSRDGILANAMLTMPRNSRLGVSNETLTAQARYTPQNPRYRGMQKYSSADAWCGYSIIAPPNLNAQRGPFNVYVQQACEGNFFSTATLSCKVESRRPEAPDAPSATAAVELRFSSERKREVVEAGYYDAVAFRGDTIIVSTTTTSIDLDNLVPEEDSQSAPDTVCYTGDVTKAKKILWAMLGNTDGNGDHWLDEGATITARNGNALEVRYSVTGEGGSQPRSLSVPVCR